MCSASVVCDVCVYAFVVLKACMYIDEYSNKKQINEINPFGISNQNQIKIKKNINKNKNSNNRKQKNKRM